MSWKWFGARTLYRTIARGRPKLSDSKYDPTSTIVEQRTVLICARNPAEANRKARKEAKAYTSNSYSNIYGQKVLIRFLGFCECFEMWDAPADGVEVFSNNERVDLSVSDRMVLRDRFGAAKEKINWRKRFQATLKFISKEVAEKLLNPRAS